MYLARPVLHQKPFLGQYSIQLDLVVISLSATNLVLLQGIFGGELLVTLIAQVDFQVRHSTCNRDVKN